MGEADAYIGSFDSKLHFFLWRPITAIRLAATDGNPNTTADAEWDVVGWNPAGAPDLRYWPTPPVPDYTSAHAAAGGAGSELIKSFFGSDNILLVAQVTPIHLPEVIQAYRKLPEKILYHEFM